MLLNNIYVKLVHIFYTILTLFVYFPGSSSSVFIIFARWQPVAYIEWGLGVYTLDTPLRIFFTTKIIVH